jgi:thioredoxin
LIFITEEQECNISDEYSALYFFGSWMPQHKKMTQMIAKIEEKYPKIKFLAIDVDDFKSLCRRYDISSVPTIIVRKNSSIIDKITGLVLTSAFKSFFNKILGENNEN